MQSSDNFVDLGWWALHGHLAAISCELVTIFLLRFVIFFIEGWSLVGGVQLRLIIYSQTPDAHCSTPPLEILLDPPALSNTSAGYENMVYHL